MSSAELLGQLISFDTTSRNSNFHLIEFVETFLRDLGVASVRADYAPGKTNLVASIGPAVDGGIILSGHTDTVPVTHKHHQQEQHGCRACKQGRNLEYILRPQGR